MADITQTPDFDTTLTLLQQDYESVSPAAAIAEIELWQHQLQGTDIFDDLSELKRAILNNETSTIAKILADLGKKTSMAAANADSDVPAETIAKIQHLGSILSQAGTSSK